MAAISDAAALGVSSCGVGRAAMTRVNFWARGCEESDSSPSVCDSAQALRPRGVRRAMQLVTVSWLFGSVWVTATSGAPYSLFAIHLKASEFQMGLLAALPFIASFISMPASVLTERTGARKKIFLMGLYAQRLLWFAIALVPL